LVVNNLPAVRRTTAFLFDLPWLAPALLCLAGPGCSEYDASLLPVRQQRPDPPQEDAGQVEVPDSAVDPSECMGSGEAMCTRAHADAVCVDAVCLIFRCDPDWFDCDGAAANGCEATLETPEHCGACRASCQRAHVARSRCDVVSDDGPCFIDHDCKESDIACLSDDPSNGCEPGFGDCDGEFENGCETSLRTLIDCGGCGTSCTSENSEVSCATGDCVELGCAPGYGDCNERGCESLAADPMHCGLCDNACAPDESECHGGRCTSLHCDPGTADCDGVSESGCETALDTAAACGSCGVACGPYARAQAGCEQGQCTISTCDPGFADCDTDRGNGCEIDLRSTEACGACGNDCSALPHVLSAACSEEGECGDLTCEQGWADCDGASENGCEQTLSTNGHCGRCGRVCARDNATTDCSSGSCALSECNEGFDDCNGNVDDGCEAALDSDSHCGGCGNACMNGATCQDGGCACGSSAGCPMGAECCGGVCVNTRSSCFPWPCIPGTSADEANCGACGDICLGWCCLVL
jgi:hypothetical protein